MGKRQDVNNRMFLRPSPNEEVKLLQDEKQKLRKLRLQQVRQQEKLLASKARKKFKEKERKEIDILENELKKKWHADITEKRNLLENEYYENVAHVGEGHEAALTCEDGIPKERLLEDEIKASERYKNALKRLKEADAEKAQMLNEKTEAKNKAMEIERIRAARVAALEPPVPDIAQNLESIQKHRYKQKNVDQYSSTYYHIPRERVERADPNIHQVDARHAAKEEEERIQMAKEESNRNFSEQLEKARLRHKHAKSKLMLEKDHNRLLEELEHFERVDRQRRQEIVSKIPKHVFEPPHRRIEVSEERQREIEHAFEDMYMAQTNYMGDVTMAQDALPVSPAVTDEEISDAKEERITVDMKPSDLEKDVQIDQPSGSLPELPAGEGRRKFVEEAEKSRTDPRPSSKDPLKRLLKKIDIQRDRWKSKERETAKGTAGVVIIPDDESEFSEGTLTMTTEKTRSASVESDVVNELQRKTLLHPHEEAELTRAKSKHIPMPGATRKVEIEKQREELQQQKLKLQLQQQQVMQEHLQLQFDALNNDVNEKSDQADGDDNDIKFTDLSSGVLSDDVRTIDASESDEAGINKVSGDIQPDPFHTEESGDETNLGCPGGLYSVQKSLSEDEFVPVPRVSSAGIFRAPPQPLPLHFAKSTDTTTGIDKLASAEIPLIRKSSSRPSSPDQYETGPRIDQPRLGVTFKEPSLQISPPHVAIPAPNLLEEAIASSPEALPRTVDPMQQPESLVFHDNRGTFSSPSYKPPHDSIAEDISPEGSQGRAVISDSKSPFFHIPTAISSASGEPSFQFPGNRETDTASYLHFYQQQLLEQQNRIREQQRAIQERQQNRLEQLKHFQERLRRQRNITGSGNFENIPAERSRHVTGQWQSLKPSTRYTSEDSSSSTSLAKSDKESFDGDVSHDVQKTDKASPSVNQPKVDAPELPVSEDLMNDTSSSPSRYSSELISVKIHDASILPKPSDLGLWSDSTPHVSSDATKSSSTTLDDSKSGKRVDEQSRPNIHREYGISSSTSNNNNHGDASETNSFNRSSERSSLKSGSSIDSGPLTSSLPRSMDKNISTDSSASDSNNNLLQRMESSFQKFQEMIDEAKTLNEKYLYGATHPVNVAVEKRGSLEAILTTDKSESDTKPKWDEYRSDEKETGYSFRSVHAVNDAFDDELASGHGRYKEDDGLLKDIHESQKENLKSTNINELNRTVEFSSPLTSNQENLTDFGVQLSPNIMLGKEHELLQSSPRALSVIPEETRVSEDDLSEGVLEEDDKNSERPSSPSIHLSDFFRRGDEEFAGIRSLMDSPDMQSFRSQDRGDHSEPSYRSPNYVPRRSYSLTPDGSGERQQTPKPDPTDLVKHKPDLSTKNVFPVGVITSAEASNKFGSHVNLPLTKRRSSDEPSNTSVPSDDVILSGLSSLSLSQTDQSTSGLSLQDAFRKSRPEFFRHSEERALRVKEARYRLSPVKNKQEIGNDTHDKTPEITKHETLEPFASKLGAEKIGGKKSDGGGRKIGKQEMKDRTKRLYENLPDIRQKAVEKQRERTYTTNRAKAQEFQKQTRERLRKLNAKKTRK
ncbi:centrosomal protein of 295 kDa-like [Dendronephthya gigantea]|uniref:centrosomal protein of 295 kDa-like n=1 Tax=Dendronephthya gigantea TaxID=151771 RepID=UPI00106C3F0D|nr:centrosomal protein of 295 kDa-like [Dendronephthya gigantea]XP_028403386.1 centrosomal protein of 295 kDa-like [Dendronephthya gigantea]